MWTEHPGAMALMWVVSQIVIAILAYKHGRKDERLLYLEHELERQDNPHSSVPPSTLPGNSIFPILTGKEKEQALAGDPAVLAYVIHRTGCSRVNAQEAIGKFLDQEPGMDTLRSMRHERTK